MIHLENTTLEKLQNGPELPSDVHFVRYKKPSWKKKEKISAIRAFKQVDIFDHLHDAGYAVLEIRSGLSDVLNRNSSTMRLAFDIETDGLLRGLTKIHCIVARDIDTDQEYRWDNGDIKAGLQFLLTADELWGHNIVGYDYQAIREIYPKWVFTGITYDTLILSRLFFTDLLDRDFRSRPANMPANLYGRHSGSLGSPPWCSQV